MCLKVITVIMFDNKMADKAWNKKSNNGNMLIGMDKLRVNNK